MTSLSLAAPRPVLVDRVLPRGIVADVAAISTGVALTAVLAQVAVPLWPVPVTGQTLAVLLVGASLGAARGSIAMALYALVGGLGLPVFSDASAGWTIIAGPTGGYILGFILAAAIVGWAAEREWDRGWLKPAVTFIGGSLVVFAVGLPWLAMSLGQLGLPNDLQSVLIGGFYPFIIGGLIKAAIAAAVLPLAWKAVEKRRNA
ncbi:biotin transport system substrate-specific component [Microcella alkaliphila]|uniref:Biotin transporter n=1 Tax=Microcella alkaliphila TaxID=279828 RepID=A0A4Q7TSY4_9MICO|nr:biotin transporter BioY [Microcella alkaliphila]RZT64115.1 biotin transport system substrate-specific component [Microcella alkaliphila]